MPRRPAKANRMNNNSLSQSVWTERFVAKLAPAVGKSTNHRSSLWTAAFGGRDLSTAPRQRLRPDALSTGCAPGQFAEETF